jgi:hypothetical protein
VKKYLLFAYPRFCPVGGWHDYKGSFDTIDEAVAKSSEVATGSVHRADFWHDGSGEWVVYVVDIESGAIVTESAVLNRPDGG